MLELEDMVTGEVWAEGLDVESHMCLPRDAICCQLCEQQFQTGEPRVPCVLTCFHTFCRRCLVGWAQQGGRGQGAPAAGADLGGAGFSCPTCRAVCKTPVEALQVNFALMTVVEAEQVSNSTTPLACQECHQGGEATQYCQDCSILLCNNCDNFHRQSKRFTGHILHTVAEFKAFKQGLPRQKRTCKKHTDQSVLLLC